MFMIQCEYVKNISNLFKPCNAPFYNSYSPDISYNYAPAAAFYDADDVPEDDQFEDEVVN